MPNASNGLEDGLLEDLAISSANAMDGVLSRIWVLAPGDICAVCPMLGECPDRVRCLHLAHSAGVTRRIDGPFRRFPIGARLVGQVARTLEPYVARDELASAALADPAWLAAHRVASFAALPIEHRGQCLGVLAVFSRRVLDDRDLAWLTFVSRQAAFGLAQCRALAEVDRARAQLAFELDQARRKAAIPAERRTEVRDAPVAWLRPLRDLEREAIERVLAHTGGRVSGPRGAAAILGMKPTTLDSRIKKLGARKPPRTRE